MRGKHAYSMMPTISILRLLDVGDNYVLEMDDEFVRLVTVITFPSSQTNSRQRSSFLSGEILSQSGDFVSK